MANATTINAPLSPSRSPFQMDDAVEKQSVSSHQTRNTLLKSQPVSKEGLYVQKRLTVQDLVAKYLQSSQQGYDSLWKDLPPLPKEGCSAALVPRALLTPPREGNPEATGYGDKSFTRSGAVERKHQPYARQPFGGSLSYFSIPPETSKSIKRGKQEAIKTAVKIGYAEDTVGKNLDAAKKYQALANLASKKVDEITEKRQAWESLTNKNKHGVVRKYPPWADLFGPKSDKVVEKEKIRDSPGPSGGPSYFRHAPDAAEMRSKVGTIPRSESTDSTSSSSSAVDSVASNALSVASSASSVSPPSTPKISQKDPVVNVPPPALSPDPKPRRSFSNTRVGYMRPSKKLHQQSEYKPFISAATLDTKVPSTIQESSNGSLTQSPPPPVLCLKIKPRKKSCNVKSEDKGLPSEQSTFKSSTVDELFADTPLNENGPESVSPLSKPEERNDRRFLESLPPPVPNLSIIRRRNNAKGRSKSNVALTKPFTTSLSPVIESRCTTKLSASGVPHSGSLPSSPTRLCNKSSKQASAPMELCLDHLDLLRRRDNSDPGIKSKRESNINTRRSSAKAQSLNTTLTNLTLLKAQLDVLLFAGPEAIFERLRSDKFSRIMSNIAESMKTPSEAYSTAPSTPIKEVPSSLPARGPRVMPEIQGAVREMKRLYQQLSIKTTCLAISLRSCKALTPITSTCLSLAAGERRYLDLDSPRSPSFPTSSLTSIHDASVPKIPSSPTKLPEWQRKLTSQLNGALLTIATYERCVKAHKSDIISFSKAVEKLQSRCAPVLKSDTCNLWVEVRNHIEAVLGILDSKPGKVEKDKKDIIVKIVGRRKESITQIDEFGIEMDYGNREAEKKEVKVVEKRNEKMGVEELMKRLLSEGRKLKREMARLNLNVDT